MLFCIVSDVFSFFWVYLKCHCRRHCLWIG